MAYNTRLLASAARTATNNSSALAVPIGSKVYVLLNVSAASGTTPTLDCKLQWSHDNGTTWAEASSADSLAQKTAAGNEVKEFTAKGSHLRVVSTIGGTTPSFTYSVDVSYA